MTRLEQENINIEKYSKVLLKTDLGELTPLEFSNIKYYGRFKHYYFNLKCKCGNVVERQYQTLLIKTQTKHCGCLNYMKGQKNKMVDKDKTSNKKHYNQWNKYKNRYGLSGNWQNYFQFEKDYNLIIQNKQFTCQIIKPIDKSLPLGIDNYRVIDQKEKQNNRKDNRCFTFNGETKTLAEWSENLNFEYQFIYGKMRYGKTFEEALLLIDC